ncbi:hypothetical protein CsSME_00054137 [Camellia sinensis var. sinensis]
MSISRLNIASFPDSQRPTFIFLSLSNQGHQPLCLLFNPSSTTFCTLIPLFLFLNQSPPAQNMLICIPALSPLYHMDLSPLSPPITFDFKIHYFYLFSPNYFSTLLNIHIYFSFPSFLLNFSFHHSLLIFLFSNCITE